MKVASLGADTVRPFPIPFFLALESGQRFCLYHPAASTRSSSDCVLHIHAFAEEMNKCRRSAALLARKLANEGIAVLQIDLLGCGDSSGEFADADWTIWQQDLLAAMQYLRQRHEGKLHLWADRLGTLLAAELITTHNAQIDQILLSQPVFDGDQYIHQLQRSLVARAMLNPQGSDAALVTKLHTEIAGYELSDALIHAIRNLSISNNALAARQIHWIEIVKQLPATLPPARQKVFDQWREIGNPIQLHCVQGEPFWQTPEVCTSETWLAACAAVFTDQA
ncbi:hydrolase 2, exosortase A system-associated [Sapientia aquatica]|uniref:Hydrolase 2, exosortase A system-associated n=1 Tax=Sapientia aquatica TaxID=1549640 RepID=A0A4R5W0W4_9BURK|nr:hydrolase 2, exosortase A system-associated [Sapientia aquatica]TDK65655.1 hydrolase 2, exosortase A system-associated [Sapientia aquatica]